MTETDTKRRSRRLTIPYPPDLEHELREVAAKSGVPLGRLKAAADALVDFPTVQRTWQAFRHAVEKQADLFDEVSTSILLDEETDAKTADEFLDDLRDGDEGPAEGEDLDLHDAFV